MASQEEIRKSRIQKLKAIKKVLNPYPAKGTRTHSTLQAIDLFDDLSKKAEGIEDPVRAVSTNEISLLGRLRSVREHGGSTFAHLEDSAGQIQLYFKKDILGEKDYKFFLDNLDIGDFIEVKGKLFLTKKEEKTLEVAKFKILTKSLLPLPEEWYGFKNVEERFRKRYLDLLMNKKVRDKFVTRSQLIKSIRNFLDKEDFIEVETPILQSIYGGALAQPFKTHLNALDLDLYLRIAPELYLKRLLIGGFEKVYEIGRCFRNEGMDSQHNPDFTMLEFYWAYADYQQLMEITEDLFEHILKGMGKKDLKVKYQDKEINFEKPFKKVEFTEIAKNDEEFKEAIKKIIQPTFVINSPKEILPLAKQLEEDPDKVASFQLIVGGLELVKAFSELNDPLEQDKRLKQQEENRKKGDKEAHAYDKDFIEALEYGMPPASGLGMGLDRLAALLTDSHSLREIILFPTMKPKVP